MLKSYADLLNRLKKQHQVSHVPGLLYEDNVALEEASQWFLIKIPVGGTPTVTRYKELQSLINDLKELRGEDVFAIPGLGSIFEITVDPMVLRAKSLKHAYQVNPLEVIPASSSLLERPSRLYYMGNLDELLAYTEE